MRFIICSMMFLNSWFSSTNVLYFPANTTFASFCIFFNVSLSLTLFSLSGSLG